MTTFSEVWLDKSFWPRVKKNPDTGCWEWIGNIVDGYGAVWVGGQITSDAPHQLDGKEWDYPR